jgi:spermidine synthase
MTTLELTANGDQTVRTDRFARRARVLCVLIFFSGFPAMIYQLTWQWALSGIFGGSIEAVTILVAAFMVGLGLGSLAGGWLSKRRDIPLLPLLAAIELVSGACGLASLQIFNSAGALTSALPLTAAAALALVVVPALPMGATLPLLVNHLVRRVGRVGNAVGRLYCVNILGAGAACLACLLLLFPFAFPIFGMPGAVYVAVAINAAVALAALVVHWRDRRDPTVASGEGPAAFVPRKPMLGLVPLLGLAAAGGFVALSYEIFFLRTVSYATGASSTAFAATSGAFLVGLAAGARRAGDNCTALTRDGAMRRAVGALMKANLLGLLFLPLLDHLAWLDRGIIGVAILMVYLAARFWGSLLPYLAELGVAADHHAGMRTAILHLANCLGAAAGALFTGFVLMDQLGLVATAAALVVAGLVCAVLLISALKMPRAEKILRASLAVALSLLAVVVIPHWSASVLDRLQWISAPYAEPLVQPAENRNPVTSAKFG